MGIDIAEEISRRLNFTLKYSSPADGQFGTYDGGGDGGGWTGMVGDLDRGLADVAVSFLDVLPERSRAVDFTLAVLREAKTLTTQVPRRKDQGRVELHAVADF